MLDPMERNSVLTSPSSSDKSGISVDTQSDTILLSVKGWLDATSGALLEEAIVAAGGVAESRCAVVDLSRAAGVTADGRRSLVACVQLAARAQLGLRFRFGHYTHA